MLPDEPEGELQTATDDSVGVDFNRARRLALLLLGFATVLFIGLEVRLFGLQVVHAKDPDAEYIAAYRSKTYDETRPRGAILDRTGGVLAQTVSTYDVCVWTPEVPEGRLGDVAEGLAGLLGLDPATVRERLDKHRWARVAIGIRDPMVLDRLRELTRSEPFRTLHLESRWGREYPRGRLFTPLIGCLTPEPPEGETSVQGEFGLEWRLNRWLRAESGTQRFRLDNRGAPMFDPDLDPLEPGPGCDVVTTLDPVIQDFAERALEDAVREFRPNWVQALVIDPNTAELLAVAQRPAPSRPGRPLRRELEYTRPYATHLVYPPGSTLKPFMAAYALDRNLVRLDEEIHCDFGASPFGGRVLHDVDGGYGKLTPEGILVNSSNIGMAKMLVRAVPRDVRKGSRAFQPILDYLNSFGFGARQLGLPGESVGILPKLEKFTRNYTLVSLSFGHEIGVTAVQMAAAAATLINGGTWRSPRVLRGVISPSGDFQEAPHTAHPGVIDPARSAQLRRFMARVVEEGGTKSLRPDGYSMGGKTGTAQTETDHSKTTPSFFCFSPVKRPRVAVLVVMDDPKKGRFASEISAPTASRILERALHYLRVPQDRLEEPEASESGEPTGLVPEEESAVYGTGEWWR